MLKRRGKRLIPYSYLNMKKIENININKYFKRLQEENRNKKVLIMKFYFWNENYLREWLQKNYSFLGFQKIIEEHTKEYNKIKKEMGFYGYPDFLVKTNNKILKLEIECFTTLYNHANDYCDIIFCYENNQSLKNKIVISLKDILGYQEIINRSEILDYMNIKYKDFRDELREKILEKWSEKPY